MAAAAIHPIATADRASINRQNASHSTGPRTALGKDRTRWNALRHGAYSESAVLAHEDPAAYNALGAKLNETFQPANDQEFAILQTIQDAQWRLDRVLSLESNLSAVGIREHLEIAGSFFPDETPAGRIDLARAYAYREHAHTFEQFHRQETRLRRILDRAFAAFVDLKLQTDEPADPPSGPASQAHPVPAASGFVSQEPEIMPVFTGPLAEIKRKQWLRRHSREHRATVGAVSQAA